MDATLRFEEVVMSKSVDDLLTSQSIRGHGFPNF